MSDKTLAQVQEESAKELAPPHTGDGQGPGTVNTEIFPTMAEPKAEAEEKSESGAKRARSTRSKESKD